MALDTFSWDVWGSFGMWCGAGWAVGSMVAQGDVSFGCVAVGWGREMAQLQAAELSTAIIPVELGLVWDVRCRICQLDLSQQR